MEDDYDEPHLTGLPMTLNESILSVELISDIVNDSLRYIYTKDLIGHYMMGITTLTISCIGFVGNVLSIGVLASKLMRGTTTNMYLIALAASDALMLLFAILVAVRDARVPQLGVASWELWADMTFFPKCYPFFHAFANLFQACSNWLTAAFTIDRYLMICHPFIAKRFCTIPLSKLIIACILSAALCYTVPRFLEYKFVNITVLSPLSTGGGFGIGASVEAGGQHINISWYMLSDLGQSASFRNGYHLWSWCILVIGIPSIIIAVLNVFLVREINKSIRRMRHEHGVKNRQQETDVMLIGVIVIFFVCQIPSSVSHVLWGTQKQSANTSITWLVVNEVGNLLIILNASINIIPYYMFSRKFRNIFMRVYFGWALGFLNKRRKPNVTTIKLQRCRSLQAEPNHVTNGSVPILESKSDGFFA